MSQKIIRRYSELIWIPTFEERFEYLKLSGVVGKDTFGFDRYLNQQFYHSRLWRTLRDEIIIRDNGCDLAVRGRDIESGIVIHHMNPVDIDDIVDVTEFLMNPDYLVCTSDRTHKAIHYGSNELLLRDPVKRSPFDTCPWKK
jgi:hypothetical protein